MAEKTDAGIQNVDSLPVVKIKELQKWGLKKSTGRGEGVEVMCKRLRQSVQADIDSGRLLLSKKLCGEF